MADQPENQPESPPLLRPYEVDSLPANRLIKFDLVPSEEEQKALTASLGLTGLKKMRMTGQIAPLGSKSWQLDAELGATVSQVCVISSEPVRTRIDVELLIKFVPENKMPDENDETVLNEEFEQLDKIIDIGIIATEALSLEIPLYPRKEGAELQNTTSAPAGEAAMSDAEIKPFAGLAALKEKLGKTP